MSIQWRSCKRRLMKKTHRTHFQVGELPWKKEEKAMAEKPQKIIIRNNLIPSCLGCVTLFVVAFIILAVLSMMVS